MTLSGPTALNPGQAGTYTITATQVAINTNRMGLNVAASDPGTTLSIIAGQCTKSVAVLTWTEITHDATIGGCSALKQGNGTNTAFYQFTYTMPAGAAAGSTHTLYGTSAWGYTGGSMLASDYTITTRPPATTTVTPSNVTSSAVDLAWTGGGPEYRIVYKTGASAPANETDGTQIDKGSATSHTVTGLAASTQYTFRVFSKVSGASVFSSTGANTTIVTTGAPAATRHVNAATGLNAGNCSSPGTPCKTITYAMGQATAGNPGDIISVAPGTYNVALGEVFPITFKTGVQLIAVGGTPVIDGSDDPVKGGLIRSQSNNSAFARIEGFFIMGGMNFDLTGGCPTSLGGALYISNSSGKFTLHRNTFYTNEARGYSSTSGTGCIAWGGAVAVFSSVVEITDNRFTLNTVTGGNGFSHPGSPLNGNEDGGSADAGALYVGGGTGTIANNTFLLNSAVGGNAGVGSNGAASGGPGRGGAIVASATTPSSLTIQNNIFSANTAASGSGQIVDPSTAGAMTATNAIVANNLFHGNLLNNGPSSGDTLGSASVLQDPQFHSPGNFNVRIRVGSPAAGAGSATFFPPIDFDGTTRPTPPSIGAFEPSLVATSTALASNANPSTFGQSVTFTATVSTVALDVVPGTVTFKDGANALCSSVALSNGQAQCTTSALSVGSHAMTAEYAGSATYAPSTSPTVNQGVNNAATVATSTALTSNLNPSPVGASVTFTATVSTATLDVVPGTVTFKEGATVLCGNVALANGQAQCSISSLSAGNHALTAEYAGSAPYLASTSPTLNQGVSGPGLIGTSTTLASSANPSVTGQSVTFTATVVSAAPGPVPGNVTFKEGGTVLCNNVALSSGQAQCAISTFPAGTHAVTAEYAGNATYLASISPTLNQVVNTNPARLFGISTRANVLTGDNVVIGGFILEGAAPKTVVVRARGPSLGVAGALQDPTLIVVPAAGGASLANDDWQTAANAGQLQASGFAPGNAKESAVMATLNPGAYTAIVSGVGNTTGVAIVEVYELDHPDVPAIGISTRGLVQTSDNVMIGGFIIQGDTPLTVVVRARGPSLNLAGALADPTMTIVPASGAPSLLNDDWLSDSNAGALQASGFAPAHPKEAAILVTLNPGAYTAIVSGVGGTTGVAIVEVYVVD